LDTNGQTIKNGMPYRIFVLSVGVGVSYGVNALSVASPVVTLTTAGAPAATGVVAADVADTGTSSDLRISFNKAADESNIQEYRIFVVQSANASSFNLATAINASPAMTIAPNGSSVYQQTPLAGAKDTSGALITNGVSYQVFVLSLAKSGNSSLSSPSAAISLSSPVQAGEVTGVQAVQVGNQLSVTWALPNEAGISGYAVILMKEPSGVLNESSAYNYYQGGMANSVAKGTNNIMLTVGSSKAVGGTGTVEADAPYKVYVLSLADGTNATIHKLSAWTNGTIVTPQAPATPQGEVQTPPVTQ